jgi:hypothetical protein
MDGLIGQAQSQLWKIVNELATTRQDGQTPDLQVALYEYGNNRLPAEGGHIRLVVGFTNDLDEISAKLFGLTTNGGNEYCGQVIDEAIRNLQWMDSNGYKAIFIAGNEPFTQGMRDYRKACKAAIERGVIVNTIFCGSHAEGISTQWQDGAVLADGSYTSIDQNAEPIHVDAPQDQEIAALSAEINETYVPYGEQGQEKLANQQAQDANAASLSAGTSVQRTITKASAMYTNASWDLVDAIKDGLLKLDEVKVEALPPAMQAMSLDERKDFVQSNLKKRADLQRRVQELSAERQTYVAEKLKEKSDAGQDTLDEAIIQAVREQAARTR